MKMVELDQILTKKEISVCRKYLDENKLPELRQYLTERREILEKKGIIADYLYYMLQHLRNERRI